MNQLCEIDEVKRLLKIDTNDDDDLLEALISASSELVVGYLKGQATVLIVGLNDSPFDVSVVPNRIRIATAMLVGYLKNNPDSDDNHAFDMGYLPKPVMALLYADRDPELA